MTLKTLLDPRQPSSRNEDRTRHSSACDICQEPIPFGRKQTTCKECLNEYEETLEDFN